MDIDVHRVHEHIYKLSTASESYNKVEGGKVERGNLKLFDRIITPYWGWNIRYIPPIEQITSKYFTYSLLYTCKYNLSISTNMCKPLTPKLLFYCE